MSEPNETDPIGAVTPTEITGEMKKSYLDYAMSVIVSRALPDVRDGLKPVQRRILFAMHQMGLSPSARFQKAAKVVGETMGKFHPHGDQPIYDALVNLAQQFSMRYPLVWGQGNFGSIDGDPPAAMRYTECKLTRMAIELLEDVDKETVPFVDNFDSSLKEPVYLTAKLPNLLLMGAEGIAVGMATKIPPHNLGEVVEAIIATIEKKATPNNKTAKAANVEIPHQWEELSSPKREVLSQGFINSYHFDSGITLEELLSFIPGPDFPTAGVIYDRQEVLKAYTTGKGKIPIRGVAEIEETPAGKARIIISELPYQVNKSRLVAKIADLVKNKRLAGITELRDESDREGIRVVVELSRGTRPKSILNNLYKYTELQTSFPVNMVGLVNKTPQTVSLKTILTAYVNHRQEVIIKRSLFELEKARRRAHILEGLKIALRHLDKIIETIKKSPDAEKARINLMKKFALSELQAEAILDMQLRRLAALERKKIDEEYQEVSTKIEGIEALLKSQDKILAAIKQDLGELKEKYGDPRRTKVIKQPLNEISEQDLIPNKETMVVLTADNYIKCLPEGTYRTQKRGGRGVSGMTTKESDEIIHLNTAMTHDDLLFFTNQGKVYMCKVYEIFEGSRRSKGQALVNIIGISQGENVSAILPVSGKTRKTESEQYFFFTTSKGVVKKTPVSEFKNIRSSGLIAIKLNRGDELIWVKTTSGKNQMILATHNGKSIRFAEKNVRAMGRDTTGVRGIKLTGDDCVIGVVVIPPGKPKVDLLVVAEKGLGKRVKLKHFPIQRRGGQGVKLMKIAKKTGKVAGVGLVTDKTTEVVLTAKSAQTIKLPIKNVPCLGRNTQGVILMRFESQDSIAALTCVDKTQEVPQKTD